jgi:CRP-like cAMP-binding protein
MDTSSVLRNIAKHVQLSDAECDHFVSLLMTRNVRRREYLLSQGEVCHAIYYIHRGVFRAFYRDGEGHESMIMFGIDDWWITDMYSFTSGEPAMLYIEAVEDSEVLVLSKQSLDGLFVNVPGFERFFRIIMQNSYVREQLRTVQNLSLSAAERYAWFVKKYPAVVQRLPQKYIASYLGITPEFLSAIRRNQRPD